MSYYDEDFYYEPSEFDLKVEEFKESLSVSVKEEFLSEMERLRKENAELQEVKANFKQIKAEYDQKKRELDFEKSNLKSQVRRERLSELMKDFEVIMYRAYSKTVFPPKCDTCDRNRRIKYTTPLGREAYEDCQCKKGKTVYSPREYICKSFEMDQDGKKLKAWYVFKDNDDYASFDYSTFAKTIYHEGLKYEDLNNYDTFFKSTEECQGYCDFLNAKE
ncbi:hypothetical protein Gp_81 [Bacillus phage vB_Bacillus_1020A]|uniref:hypothetical protein n=1 Tax=Robertmurraya sp. DFI.2.37 TaxID=3031819 RepID=UPI0012453727|nr:hypothetical protein [Robertmurraya sp. DFI.2.37]MDF1511083.1 hypothetical protein [Robertmurraya sp. DFI.2.37]QIW89355.1 hypothetical protein Gp_81 [Bacillus phage vB_Bacillus_1020A]